MKHSNYKLQSYARRGVAIITVMLIILTLTIVATFTLAMTQTETQSTSAFRFNRQAAYAAHGVSNHMFTQLNNDATNNADVIFQQLKMGNAVIQRTADIKANTGLSDTVNDATTPNQIKGDLSRAITQLGSYEDLSLIIGDTVGMSDASMFCRYNLSMNAVAIAGRAATPSTDSGKNFFTLNNLNKRVSARKYEMAYILYQPASCQ